MRYKAQIISYEQLPNGHRFHYTRNQQQESATGKKIFIAAGVDTPKFMKDVMNGGSHLIQESTIREYLTSYFKIDTGKEDTFHESNFPSWTQFLDEDYETGYGFPEHTWDQPVAGKRCIKVGTMAHDPYDPSTKNDPIPANDHRVTAVEHYVRDYMQNLRMTSSANYKHPVVLYDSRETLLDYANRTRTDIVVQNGGWIGKYYPLLARTAYDMIFNPDLI